MKMKEKYYETYAIEFVAIEFVPHIISEPTNNLLLHQNMSYIFNALSIREFRRKWGGLILIELKNLLIIFLFFPKSI